MDTTAAFPPANEPIFPRTKVGGNAGVTGEVLEPEELVAAAGRQGGMGLATVRVVLEGISPVLPVFPTLAMATDKAWPQNEVSFTLEAGREVMEEVIPSGAPCITEITTWSTKVMVLLLFDGMTLVMTLRREEPPEGGRGSGF